MAFDHITGMIFSFLSARSILEGQTILEPLVLFVVGMVVYSIFIFKFYRFISRRNIFAVKRNGHHDLLKSVLYVLEYIFLFPVISFFWFFVISFILSILSSVLTIGDMFMVTMAMIATIRITAYYNENLSQDVAKLIPFTLLAVFLLDITHVSADAPLTVFQKFPESVPTLFYYFGFIVALEFFLRVVAHIVQWKRK